MMLQSSTIRQRKAPPPGIYDPTGNILSKSVAGKTTTYTYDKANQLVSSTNADGKVTKYEYDAAGRMVKEGEKTFAYGWLDKVMQVAENGKTTQTYTYDMLGQLATADYGDSRETFLWDGLALLSRNNLKYVNEPAVTGGNPILAGDKMLFDDMLGNTLGVKDGEKFSAIDRDAFGELKPGEKPNLAVNFFTGKPEIDGLGYSFLFRNYRADLGKWQTTDPLGYPDGWNNLAYVNNQVIKSIDFLGAKVYWCARDLAGSPVGNHHFLTFIPDNPNDFNGNTVDMGNGAQGWTNGGQEKDGKLVSTPNEGNDLQSIRELRDPQNYPPGTFSDWDGEMHEIPTPQGMTDTQFIKALQKAIYEYQNNCPYSLVDENCAAWVNSMLERVGIPQSERERLGEFFGVDWGEEDLIPSQYFVKE